MIYLASIYSLDANEDTTLHNIIREIRARYAMERLAELMKDGETVYSPIAHCHQAGVMFDLPKDFAYWERIDKDFLSQCNELVVLDMESYTGNGISDSLGVSSEVAYAKNLGLPITVVPCPDYDEQQLINDALNNKIDLNNFFPTRQY